MLRLNVVFAVAFVSFVLTRCESLAGDAVWPGWLGPNRDGWVADFQPPANWPDKLRRSWQVEVGTGYGTPIVANDRVYQHARQGADEVVWCIDLSSGDVLWRKSYAVPFKIGGGGERHGKGPKSNPIYAAGRLFAMSIVGDLRAWNAETGELLWQSEYSSRFKQGHPYWGTSGSPIVDGNRIVAHFGTDDEGVLVAMDVATGDEVWSQGNHGPDYSSPLLVEINGVRQIIDWNQKTLAGVESTSGKLLWEYPFPHVGHNQNMPTPTFYQGGIILGAENRGIHRLEPNLADGKWSVKERWHQEKLALDMSTAVINGDSLYGFSHYDSGKIFCLDPATGEIRWSSPGRVGQNVTFLSIPNHVLALINDGQLHVIDANNDEYEKVATYRVAETQTWAAPVLLNDGILVKDNDKLTFWKLK